MMKKPAKKPVKKKGPPHPRGRNGAFLSKAAIAKRKYRETHKRKAAAQLHRTTEQKTTIDWEKTFQFVHKEYKAMKEAQKKALIALAAACTAVAAAAQALASASDDETAPAATPEPAKAPAKAQKPAKVADPPAPPPPAEEKKGPTLYEQAVEAAKEYSQVYGRDGLVKVMASYIPAGKKTMQDIPEDKLEAFIKELKG